MVSARLSDGELEYIQTEWCARKPSKSDVHLIAATAQVLLAALVAEREHTRALEQELEVERAER